MVAQRARMDESQEIRRIRDPLAHAAALGKTADDATGRMRHREKEGEIERERRSEEKGSEGMLQEY
jgi:hypothetical protein